jgi:hypothetical protein
MPETQLHLRVVGKKNKEKEKKKVQFEVIREEGEFSDEELPEAQP